MTNPTARTIEDLLADGSILAIQDGNHGETHPKATEYVPEGIPFIMASDIRDGRVLLSQAKRLPKARTDQLRIGFALPGDVLLTHKGTVGEAAIAPKVPHYLMLTPQVTYYRTNPQQLDARYLVFAFRSPFFQDQLVNVSAQSTRPYVSITTQRRLLVPWHEPAIQRRIASVLGAYEDLIEVNLRRISLLEEMAQRLFEEWFVRFQFPGHEGHAVVDTPEGPLPGGWQRVRLEEVADVNANTLRPPNVPDRIGYVDIASVARGEIQKVEWQPFVDAPGRARRKVRDGSTIWSMVRPNRRSYALVLDPEDDLIVSTGFAVLDPRDISLSYLYHFVTTDAFVGYLVNNTSGAAYPAVTGAAFERALILLPPKELDRKFDAVVEPMMRLINTMRRQNFRLAASRDLLLPRLISGELSVSAAEGALERAA
jgi:type I restriction enzyme S subunit